MVGAVEEVHAMSAFADWLAERAAAREAAGLTRRLFASDVPDLASR